eukprot:1676759-Prymnesium_polylepis.1
MHSGPNFIKTELQAHHHDQLAERSSKPPLKSSFSKEGVRKSSFNFETADGRLQGVRAGPPGGAPKTCSVNVT